MFFTPECEYKKNKNPDLYKEKFFVYFTFFHRYKLRNIVEFEFKQLNKFLWGNDFNKAYFFVRVIIINKNIKVFKRHPVKQEDLLCKYLPSINVSITAEESNVISLKRIASLGQKANFCN